MKCHCRLGMCCLSSCDIATEALENAADAELVVEHGTPHAGAGRMAESLLPGLIVVGAGDATGEDERGRADCSEYAMPNSHRAAPDFRSSRRGHGFLRPRITCNCGGRSRGEAPRATLVDHQLFRFVSGATNVEALCGITAARIFARLSRGITYEARNVRSAALGQADFSGRSSERSHSCRLPTK